MNIDLCKSTLFFGRLPLLGVRVLFAHRSPSRRGNISFPTLFNKWPDRIWQPLCALVAPWWKSATLLRNPRLKPSKITLDISSMLDLYHIASLHYRLRAIRDVPLGVVNFTPHFIVIQIFQILFLQSKSFYTHTNISDIFVGDEINLFNLTFHDIANY